MKIISWNVNGLRAVLKKGFLDFLNKESPDILCLQEIKISSTALAELKLEIPGYQAYWHSAERAGYSGTAILIKQSLSEKHQYSEGLGVEKFDSEGRAQILELPQFYLINAYFPNANPELSRLGYKLEFNEALLAKAKQLEKKKPVIITGDYNVAHQEIDLASPKENVGSPGFTPQEREWLDKFIAAGFIDTFRELQGDQVKYSWWSYRSAARARNIGWRIDYFCVSPALKKKLIQADILDQVLGSDHAPVILEIS